MSDKLGPVKWDTPCKVCGGENGWRGAAGIQCICEMQDKHLVNTFLHLRRVHGAMRFNGDSPPEGNIVCFDAMRSEMMKRSLYKEGWVRIE